MLESNLDTDRKHRDRWASGVQRTQLIRKVVHVNDLIPPT